MAQQDIRFVLQDEFRISTVISWQSQALLIRKIDGDRRSACDLAQGMRTSHLTPRSFQPNRHIFLKRLSIILHFNPLRFLNIYGNLYLSKVNKLYTTVVPTQCTQIYED